MALTSDTLVIGAGMVGLSCALGLQRAGQRVTVIDDDVDGQAASWGNAGHIATEQVAPLASFSALRSAPRRLFAFGGPIDFRQTWRLSGWIARYLAACAPSRYRAGCDAMRSLLAEAMPAWKDLTVELGAPELLRETGHIVCWETPRTARRAQTAWRRRDIGNARITTLDSASRAGLQRVLAKALPDAVAFTGTGQITDHQRLRTLSCQHLAALGGQLRHGKVTGLTASSARELQVQLADGTCLMPARIVVCAGVHSAALLAPLGLNVPIVAERGYHLQWAEHDWPDDLPPIVFEDRSIIVTRVVGGLRMAGFVEYAPPNTPPDPRKWQRLAQHAAALGLPVRGTVQRWFGARPTLADYLPAIGQVSTLPGLFYAFGHQHLGLTLAPVTAQLIEAQILGEEPFMPLRAFDLARFS